MAEIDRFAYVYGFPAEDIELYKPGGFHPVHLKDSLHEGRYTIIDKLGFGSFSTVWLARDHLEERNVAIKIAVAEEVEHFDRELNILQHIQLQHKHEHPGYKHILQVLDSFHVEGPNGRHLCIVTELLGPKLTEMVEWMPGRRLPHTMARSVSRQLLLAVDLLHSCGVAHGDIYAGNVLFRLKECDSSTDERSDEATASDRIGMITRKDGAQLGQSLPQYFVDSLEYSEALIDRIVESPVEIKLVDYGESFLTSSPPQMLHTPMPFHPPELVFRHKLTQAVDIWNLGCATYAMLFGRSPFEADFDDRELIPQFQKVVGGLPVEWLLDALNDGVLKDGAPEGFEAEDFVSLEDGINGTSSDDETHVTTDASKDQVMLICAYLRKAMVVNPEQRLTSTDLLKEQWVSESPEAQPEAVCDCHSNSVSLVFSRFWAVLRLIMW